MPVTPPKDLGRKAAEELEQFVKEQTFRLVEALKYIGEEAMKLIRTPAESGGVRRYKDQSGNLTSSVGYVVVIDGEVVYSSSFEATKPTATEGPKEGREYAYSLASQYPQGIALIVVAGMNYAAYVEAKGLGGMTSGELFAKDKVHKLLNDLEKDADKFAG